MKLTDIKKPITTWLQLSDSRNNCINWGELMFSLSYLPTAERLTVVVVKARNLKPGGRDENSNRTIDNNNEIHNVFVKVSPTIHAVLQFVCHLQKAHSSLLIRAQAHFTNSSHLHKRIISMKK